MSNFRSQFKATSIAKLRHAVGQDDKMMGAVGNEYLNLEDGHTTKIRIFPAHPGEENFYVPRKCYWLSFINDEGETRRSNVLDSIVHGRTAMDIVQEYISLAKSRYGDDSDKMDALLGSGVGSNSLRPQYSWVCYADAIDGDEVLHAKLWEFKKTVRDGLNRLAFSEDDDEPIEIDPFTDPDEGCVIAVKYNKNPNRKKGENYYEVDFARRAKQPIVRPLSDDELEEFMTMRPLSELFSSYGIRDFERALEGLQNWDDENEFHLFSDAQWMDTVQKVRAQYVVEASNEDEEEEETEELEKELIPQDELSSLDRTALKQIIKTEGLAITVKRSMTDNDLRQAIREVRAETPVRAEKPQATQTVSTPNPTAKSAPTVQTRVSLDDIRRRLKRQGTENVKDQDLPF